MEKEEMEAALIHEEMAQQHKNPLVQRSKGGFITMPFIIGMQKKRSSFSFLVCVNHIYPTLKQYCSSRLEPLEAAKLF